MRLLAIDTASRSCGAAVVEGRRVLSEFTAQHGDTHSRHLMDMVRQALAVARLRVMDMDGFAVTLGPGSFTGLRIGLSTVKGLALAARRPVAGVGSLEALAAPFSCWDALVCPMLDARRREVYTALYRFRDGRLETLLPPHAASPDQAAAAVGGPCIFVGDGVEAYQDRIRAAAGDRARFADTAHHTIRPAWVALMALGRFETGGAVDAAALTPCYIRPSDAQTLKDRQIK